MNHNKQVITDKGAALPFVYPLHEAAEFEARLAEWEAGVPMQWAELMTAWVEMSTAPVSRSLVLRLIMGLIEM